MLAPGSRLHADLVLESELTALWFDRRRGNVRVALAIVLIAPGATQARLLLERSFAAAIVAATHRAVAEVLSEIEGALTSSPQPQGVTTPASSPAHR